MGEAVLRRVVVIGTLIPTLGIGVVGAAAAQPVGASAAHSVSDPAGDTVDDDDAPVTAPRADVVSGSLERAGGNLVFRYTTAETVDPRSDPNWGSGDTFANFALDVDGDGEADFDVEYGVEEGALYAEVYGDPESDDPPMVCSGTADFDSAHVATVPASCVGSPASLGYRVETGYDTNTKPEDGSPVAYDTAPDDDAFAGPA